MPREIVDGIAAGMVVPATSLRMGGVKLTPALPFAHHLRERSCPAHILIC
jgi:hypothetical protein